MSGVGEDVTEADELLSEMRGAREEQIAQQNEMPEAIQDRDQESWTQVQEMSKKERVADQSSFQTRKTRT